MVLLDSATLELTLYQGYLWTWDLPAFTSQDIGFWVSTAISTLCGSEVWVQDWVCARQILYQLSYFPSPRLSYKTYILGARLIILGHTEGWDRIWISSISGSLFLYSRNHVAIELMGWLFEWNLSRNDAIYSYLFSAFPYLATKALESTFYVHTSISVVNLRNSGLNSNVFQTGVLGAEASGRDVQGPCGWDKLIWPAPRWEEV